MTKFFALKTDQAELLAKAIQMLKNIDGIELSEINSEEDWEDLIDNEIAKQRLDEPTFTLEEVLQQIQNQ